MGGRTAIILIVDDEHSILALLDDVLTDEGFTVERAANGQEALLRALHAPPDLIVTDLMMPIMDGRTLAQQLRQHRQTTHIPILLISAAYREHSEDLFTAVLPKPFDLATLIDTIHALLL